MIIVAGDLNRKSIDGAFDESPDIKKHCPIATRGNAALDIIFSNLANHTEQSLPPLSNDYGPKSDHNVLLVKSEEHHLHHFEKKTVKHCKYTDEGRQRFRQLIINETWESMRRGSSSESAEALNELLVNYLDECFPWKQFTVKSTDPPWMNPEIKRCAKRKRRTFKLHGRGPRISRTGKGDDEAHGKG